MKKKIILILALTILTGCVNVENSSYDQIVEQIVKSDTKISNTYRKGYKFYLPKGLYIYNSKDYNETIKSESETFFLYIDLISYLNKTPLEYENEENVYFKTIDEENAKGYIQIKNAQKDKYLVEIAYNCAKIEVIVEKTRSKKAVSEAMIILSSIQYNDTFLTNLSDDSLLNYKEEIVDIFDKGNNGDTSNVLEWKDEYDGYDDNIPDWDHIQ